MSFEKTNLKSLKTHLFFYLFIFVFIATIIILSLLGILTLLYSRRNIFRSSSSTSVNSISLPQGKVLYNLNTFTYREGSLFRYNTFPLIKNENEEFESIETYDDETGDNIFVTAIPHIKEEENNGVSCSGTCNCYVGENDENSNEVRISNLIYSSRFTSIVAVSIFGFAVAKFMNDALDDCYDKARTALKAEYDEESSDLPLECSFEDAECEEPPKQAVEYRCMGICLARNKVVSVLIDYAQGGPSKFSSGFNDDFWGIADDYCNAATAGEKWIEVPFSEDEAKMKLEAETIYRWKLLTNICMNAELPDRMIYRLDPDPENSLPDTKFRICTARRIGEFHRTDRNNIQCFRDPGEKFPSYEDMFYWSDRWKQ